jgi:phosphate transport system substrate-binding protein
MTRTRRISAALMVAGVLGVAAPAAASATTTITISGATASYPLVSLLAQKYVKLYPKRARFKIAQGGSQVGINDVAAGRVTVGNLSRDPLTTDPKGLVFYPIARYAICVITNKSNPLSNLTSAQLLSIFTGKTRTWSSSLAGATATGTIDVISRQQGAGVLTSFETLLMEGKKIPGTFPEKISEGQMLQAVESDPSAIGFVSNYQAEKGGVNVAAVGGVACNKADAISGQYPGVARFYEVTKGEATGAAAKFITWIEKSAPARKIISSQWLPVT